MPTYIEESNRRVFIGVRIHPNTKKFLKSMRAKNIGRAIDNLVINHQAFLNILHNRPGSAAAITTASGPSELDIEDE